MAGRITALQFQKNRPDRVSVYIDDAFAFGLPDIEAAQLTTGQFLSDADIERLRDVDAEAKAYDRALRFLGYRPRSTAEVRQNLTRAGVVPEIVDAVIERLERQGYLNDAEFARFWVENREKFRPRGQHALRQELRQKGVAEEASAGALAEVDAAESAYRAAAPRAARLAALLAADRQMFRRKIGDFLLRRGFGYDVIREVVARLERELVEPGDPEDDGS